MVAVVPRITLAPTFMALVMLAADASRASTIISAAAGLEMTMASATASSASALAMTSIASAASVEAALFNTIAYWLAAAPVLRPV